MYSRLPNIGTGAFIWQILPSRPIPNLPMPNLPSQQNLPNKGTGAYIRQARVHEMDECHWFMKDVKACTFLRSQYSRYIHLTNRSPVFRTEILRVDSIKGGESIPWQNEWDGYFQKQRLGWGGNYWNGPSISYVVLHITTQFDSSHTKRASPRLVLQVYPLQ